MVFEISRINQNFSWAKVIKMMSD